VRPDVPGLTSIKSPNVGNAPTLYAMLKQLIIPIIVLSLSTSCNRKEQQVKDNIPNDSLPHTEFDYNKYRASMLNLSSLDKGVDSFEIRIWVSSMTIPGNLVILKFDQNQWVAYKYLYYAKDDAIDSMFTYKILVPSKIDTVISYINKEKILELPSQSEIPNFNDRIADGQTCNIEIAGKNFYKSLTYHCPEHYAHEPNNVKFMHLVNFLDSFFKFYTPWCN
jgi:hypothetical protein